MLGRLDNGPFDLVVAGGGATGLGVALDAALRGLKVALLESHDFAKGTSSRATKLVHGGVRYLAQGRIGLVRESLRERSALLHNAPELVRPLPFVVPAYHFWEIPFYTAGLSLYDVLAGRDGLGATHVLSRRQTGKRLPGVCMKGLVGGIEYWDAQFDDARLAVALARAAEAAGAVVLNYVRVTGLIHERGRVAGVRAQDTETGQDFMLRSPCVVNAAGVWSDALRRLDAQASDRPVQDLIRTSRGTHLVVDRSFFPSDRALLVPRTADGRVLFAVPWLGKVLLGTTDVATDELTREPRPDDAEIDYILQEAGRYLQVQPARRDIRSAWAGLRPLVDPAAEGAAAGPVATRSISREHTVEISAAGLVTVAGGKWTTYRAMAQDALEACARAGLLATLPPCRTQDFVLAAAAGPRAGPAHGAQRGGDVLGSAGLTPAMIRHAARHEYARKVEDVLARRSRLLFLDAALAARAAPDAARILQSETGVDAGLDDFLLLARRYGLGMV
ncbi:glycerol-3-phosphate dehydrogenase/oxidase [Pusillimonas caeni]|nr:glycerol-3-phosphate dehydrogenase/oxidase [Pusillimonas caeni]TFL13930.1 glycerol-3-phosphate dehydrogenase/oxidase [Pusillimonas caeni]